MENRKNDLMIAAGIGIGGFVLGFIVAKITGKKHRCAYCELDDNYDSDNVGCDGDCDNCEFAEECYYDTVGCDGDCENCKLDEEFGCE